ncbi:hypothetical protein QG37_05814 [Candidozyma auris]|nr:hypothetical protein QG37_05814 [[Candida] auris]
MFLNECFFPAGPLVGRDMAWHLLVESWARRDGLQSVTLRKCSSQECGGEQDASF